MASFPVAINLLTICVLATTIIVMERHWAVRASASLTIVGAVLQLALLGAKVAEVTQ